MTGGLRRLQATGHSHLVTFSCYRRAPNLNDPRFCRVLLTALEAARRQFDFCVYGYVLMPEHVHLLLSEPRRSTLADVLHGIKLSSSKQIRGLRAENGQAGSFWQPRYYDRYLRNHRDFVEKLRYLHRNPVKRGLVEKPEDWPWSSFRHYALGECGVVEIESEWTAKMRAASGGNAIPG